VGPDKVIKLGKDKRNLHLTILHPKTEKRAKGDEVSLDKIVKERIQADQARAEAQKRFQGKNSKNLKKVQLRCEVFDLSTDTRIGSTMISEVIRDKQSKDYGSLELKEVRPRVSCCEGGRDIMVVTEHSVKKGTVVPVFQLFDAHGKRSEVEEQFEQFWLKQPQLEEPQDDDRIIKFLSPKQENYERWSHLTLKLKLRRKDDSDISESLSSCDFIYRPHNSFQFQISDIESGETSLVCVDCSFGFLDGDETGLSRASLPQHCGPGLKRRRLSSNTSRHQVVMNNSLDQVIHSVPVLMEDPEMVDVGVGAMNMQQMDGDIPSVNPSQVLEAKEASGLNVFVGGLERPQTSQDIWQKLDEDEKSSSTLNTPDPEMDEEQFTFPAVSLTDVQPPRGEHEFLSRDIVPDGSNPRRRIIDVEKQERRALARRPPAPAPAEQASRDLRWWTVQSLCGEDQEALQVFGSGGRAGPAGQAGLRRKFQVILRHFEIPVILLLALTVSLIFPVSPESMLAVVAAAVLAVAFIIYQNISQVNGE